MKVAVVNTFVPFIRGGAEILADSLKDKLEEYGHQAQMINIPFAWHPPTKFVESILACRLMKISNADRVIGMKFPSYFIPHENKYLWVLHQFRQIYDFFGTKFQTLAGNENELKIRNSIIKADMGYLPEAKKIFTISPIISDRLKKYNGIDSSVIYPPLGTPDDYYCEDYSDYIYYPSRINEIKRQELAILSMKYTRSDVKLIITGKLDDPSCANHFFNLISDNGLQDKVQLIADYIPEKRKLELFANCLACIFIPLDEDYGFITIEAFQSQKPLITCHDSGCPSIFVEDGINGFKVSPDPREIADAMDRLYLDRKQTQRMGKAAFEMLGKMEINWDNVIRKLTQ